MLLHGAETNTDITIKTIAMKQIRNYGKWIIFLFLIHSCATTEYVLVKDAAKNNDNNTSVSGTTSYQYSAVNQPYTGAFTNISSGNVIKPVYISEKKIKEAGFKDFELFLELCNARKFDKAEKVLENNAQAVPSVKQFLEAVLLFSQFQYAASRAMLKNIDDPLLAPEIKLLILDNEYQILKKNNNVDKTYFIHSYQNLINSKTLPAIYIEIIENRIKYLRYQ